MTPAPDPAPITAGTPPPWTPETRDNAVRWRCFHCGDTFTEAQAAHAREHFGRDEGETPVCLMRVPGEGSILAALRKAQDELAVWRAECDPLTNALHAQATDYEQRLIREEEKGYARGLKDYMKVEADRDRERQRADALQERLDLAELGHRDTLAVLKHSIAQRDALAAQVAELRAALQAAKDRGVIYTERRDGKVVRQCYDLNASEVDALLARPAQEPPRE